MMLIDILFFTGWKRNISKPVLYQRFFLFIRIAKKYLFNLYGSNEYQDFTWRKEIQRNMYSPKSYRDYTGGEEVLQNLCVASAEFKGFVVDTLDETFKTK